MRAFFVASFLAAAVCAQAPAVLVEPASGLRWRGDAGIWRVEPGAIVASSVGRDLPANSFLVLDGRDGVSGAQPVDVFVEALRRVAE